MRRTAVTLGFVLLTYGCNGVIGGETLPTSLTLTYPTNNLLSGGAGVPDFSNAIANLGEHEWEYVSLPYTDSTSLYNWEAEYNFSDTGRWGSGSKIAAAAHAGQMPHHVGMQRPAACPRRLAQTSCFKALHCASLEQAG